MIWLLLHRCCRTRCERSTFIKNCFFFSFRCVYGTLYWSGFPIRQTFMHTNQKWTYFLQNLCSYTFNNSKFVEVSLLFLFFFFLDWWLCQRLVSFDFQTFCFSPIRVVYAIQDSCGYGRGNIILVNSPVRYPSRLFLTFLNFILFEFYFSFIIVRLKFIQENRPSIQTNVKTCYVFFFFFSKCSCLILSRSFLYGKYTSYCIRFDKV